MKIIEFKEVEIDKIKPDPDQPRQSIGELDLNDMAKSIVNEGIINPIEVDEKFVIVTGELRWRAAKIAGLKTVPVKVIEKPSDKERFIRQAQENIHQNAMAPLDIAMALDKIRKQFLTTAAEAKQGSGGFRHGHPGVTELHGLLGMPESTISEYLDLLGVEGELKEALKDPKFARTKIAKIKDAPEKYREKLEHVVATQKDISRDTVGHLVKALKKADGYDEDDKAEELLKENFEGLSTTEAVKKINKIVPDEESRLKEPADALKFVSEKIIELMEFLDAHSLKSFDDFHRPLVVRDINSLGFYLSSYLKGKDMGEAEAESTPGLVCLREKTISSTKR